MTKGSWRHSICRPCWDKQRPGTEPVRLAEPDDEVCCYCGLPTISGIYVRGDPKRIHPEKEEMKI